MGTIGEGSNSIPPEHKVIYKEKLERSVALFEKSLNEYQHSEFTAQKNEYQRVMRKALSIMNESVKAELGDLVKQQTHKLSDDFDRIVGEKSHSEPLTDDEINQLQQDIKLLKKNL